MVRCCVLGGVGWLGSFGVFGFSFLDKRKTKN